MQPGNYLPNSLGQDHLKPEPGPGRSCVFTSFGVGNQLSTLPDANHAQIASNELELKK